MATAGKHVALPKPFQNGDVVEWIQKFEICANANEWTEEVRGKKLPTLLEGEALMPAGAFLRGG